MNREITSIRNMERSRMRSQTVEELREELLKFNQQALVKILSYGPYNEPEYSTPHPRQFDGGDVVL